MNEVKDKVWFLREGLFAKSVVALVGLVVFVLAINGAMEIWITYGGIKRSLADGMSEKAEATAKRIEQSMGDLERQISWVTRASSTRIEDRRADYAQLLRQVPQVSQLSLLSAQGREQLRHTRQTVTLGSDADFSRDLRFIETIKRGTSFAPAYMRDQRPFMSIGLPHADGSITMAEINLASSPTISTTRRSARWRSPMSSTPGARCWRVRPGGRRSARMFPRCRRWLP
jgi:hypothetical protein